jgi:hypothetical protein
LQLSRLASRLTQEPIAVLKTLSLSIMFIATLGLIFAAYASVPV